jgi:hypothetical protein
MITKLLLPLLLTASCCYAQLPVVTLYSQSGPTISPCGLDYNWGAVSGLYVELMGNCTTNWTGSTNGAVNSNVKWIDLSGQGNDFTNAENSSAPIIGGMLAPAYYPSGPNGYYCVDFKANGNTAPTFEALACSYVLETNQPSTIFIVATEVSTASGNTLFDTAGSHSSVSFRFGTGGAALVYSGISVVPPNFANTGNWFIYSVVSDGINTVLRTNGQFCVRGNSGGNANGRPLLGQDNTTGTTAYTGKMAAVLCYARALHSNEVAYIEGLLNSKYSLGYTITTNGGFDVGAVWGDRVVVNGGTAPSDNSKVAMTTLAEGLISDAVYSKIIASVFYATDNLTAARTPVIGYQGSDPWANNNFVSGDLTVNGLKGNTTTKTLDSGVLASTKLTANSSALFAYAITNTSNGVDIGANNAGSTAVIELIANLTANSYSDQYNVVNGRVTVAHNAAGYYCGSRTSSSIHNLYFANTGNAHASIANNATSGGSLPAFNIFAHGVNNNGAAGIWSDKTYGAFGMCIGLTSTDSSNLYNRLKTFRTAMGGFNP